MGLSKNSATVQYSASCKVHYSEMFVESGNSSVKGSAWKDDSTLIVAQKDGFIETAKHDNKYTGPSWPRCSTTVHRASSHLPQVTGQASELRWPGWGSSLSSTLWDVLLTRELRETQNKGVNVPSGGNFFPAVSNSLMSFLVSFFCGSLLSSSIFSGVIYWATTDV